MNKHNEAHQSFDDSASAEVIAALQDEVDALRVQLGAARNDIEELEAQAAMNEAKPAAPAGTAELQGLANTYRTALRTGHPDASKHLEALLNLLGA